MKLTRDQRSALFRGDPPRITFAGTSPCPVKVGHVEVLSAHVRLEVTGIRRTKKGEWALVYTLFNNRIGDRYLAPQAGQLHPAQYQSSGPSSVDPECGAAVDEFTQRRITERSRQAEAARATEVILAAGDVRQVLKKRAEASPEFRKLAGRSIYRMGAELDRIIANAKRKAA